MSDLDEQLRRLTSEAADGSTPLPAAEVMRRANRRHRRRLAGFGLAGGAAVAAALVAGLGGVAGGQHQVPPAVGPSRPATSRPATVTSPPARPSPSPTHLRTPTPSPRHAPSSGPVTGHTASPSPSSARTTGPPTPAGTPTASRSPR